MILTLIVICFGVNLFGCYGSNQNMVSDRLENVTQTISTTRGLRYSITSEFWRVRGFTFRSLSPVVVGILSLISCLVKGWNQKQRWHLDAQNLFLFVINNVRNALQQLPLEVDCIGEPLFVGMDLTIASFDAISEVNMDYTITLYLNQYWKDERLAFSNEEEILTLSGDFAEKIWVPDTFFANDKNSFLHDVTERNKLVRLNGDGSITYGMRFTTTLACMMDLHYYPLDSQNCTVEIESYGYTVMDVVMYWKATPVRGVEEAELPQFTIIGWETNDRKERLATGIYQRLSLSFKLQRNIGYFIFQTYLPSILIVMLSWVSFWINHEATSARVALGITTVLTMTTISTGVRSSLPRISYVKAIDIYLVMCFVFVFAALLEYAAVNYTYWGARAKKKIKKTKEHEEHKHVPGTKPTSEQPCINSDDIIELQDIRMSPIASIRNRHFNSKSTPDVDPSKFPPSFRISRSSGYTYNYRATPGLRYRGNKGNPLHKPKVFHAIKRGALVLKHSMPKIKDVNVIDKYSRIVFPVTFLLFNVGYWLFYFFE